MRINVEHEKSFIEVERDGKIKKYQIVPPSMPTFRMILALQEFASIDSAKMTAKKLDRLFGDLEKTIKKLFPKGWEELIELPVQYLMKLLGMAISSMKGEKKTPDDGKRSSPSRRSA